MSISTEQRFTEVVEPVAFSVAFGSKPNTVTYSYNEPYLSAPHKNDEA